MENNIDYIRDVGKAILIKKALKNMLDVEPELNFYSDHIEIFYPPDKLKIAQKNFELMMESPQKTVRTSIMPVLNPFIVKKIGFWVILTAMAIFFTGAITAEKK